jgi:hypothetical protein
MIRSAQRTTSEMALTVAGISFPGLYFASFRAARMLAAIKSAKCWVWDWGFLQDAVPKY